ncbi:hypothetical protein [Methylobacterium sp. GXS13]|uniref:hypothetical protein n=1 Tax=Methylobacterium sp. GXS13 TaxID=1730094 RepID=UPI000A9A6193|nr:hypothetical protein [Methylobacterium sp. GXS13]
MNDTENDREHAEAFWRDVAQRPLHDLIVVAHMDGAKWGRKPFADWLQTVPGIRMQTVKSPVKKAAAAKKRVAKNSTRSVAPTQTRALRGAGLAAFDAVRKAGPLTSLQLLEELRKPDGGRVSEQRDNTLLAAMRRLRNTGRLAYDGTHYTVPEQIKPDAFPPEKPDSTG